MLLVRISALLQLNLSSTGYIWHEMLLAPHTQRSSVSRLHARLTTANLFGNAPLQVICHGRLLGTSNVAPSERTSLRPALYEKNTVP